MHSKNIKILVDFFNSFVMTVVQGKFGQAEVTACIFRLVFSASHLKGGLQKNLLKKEATIELLFAYDDV